MPNEHNKLIIVGKSLNKLCTQHLNRLLSTEGNYLKSKKQYLGNIGLFGVFVYAFGFPFSKEVCYVGEWMMVGAFIFSLPNIWPEMKNDPIWKLFLVLFIFLLFKAILTIYIYSESTVDALDAVRWRLRFFWIFIIGWWLGGSMKYIHRLWITSLFGFIVLLAIGYDNRLFMHIANGHRIDFGINAQTFSLFTVAIMLGCTFLAKELWGFQYRVIRIFSWSIAIIVLLELTILSLTRASWIALFAIIVINCLFIILFYRTILIRNMKNVIISVLGIILIFGTVIIINYKVIEQRTSSESADLKAFFMLNFDEIDTASSFGKRFEVWKWSFREIKKYPLFGQKIDNTSKDFIKKSQNVDQEVANYSHVHNSYLEILLNQGIIGFVIFSCFPFYVTYKTYRLLKSKIISFRYFLFFLTLVLFFAIVNFSEAFFTKWVFWPYFSILFGSFYSLTLWQRIKEKFV